MTLTQGAGVHCRSPRIVTYSRPSVAKPPRPLKNSRAQARRRKSRRWRAHGGGGAAGGPRRPGAQQPHDLVRESPLAREQRDSGRRRGAGRGPRRRAGPPRRRKTLPAVPNPSGSTDSARADQRLQGRSAGPARRTVRRSFRITRSTASPFIRQYSCARRSWRTMSRVLGARRSARARSAGRPRCRAPTGRRALPVAREDFGRGRSVGSE